MRRKVKEKDEELRSHTSQAADQPNLQVREQRREQAARGIVGELPPPFPNIHPARAIHRRISIELTKR